MATSIQTRRDLDDRLRRCRGELQRLGVERLGVFGSFRREEARQDSDVDLLVHFAPGKKSFDRFMALSFLLEDELGRPIELLTPESLSPHLGPRILAEVDYVEIGD